MSLFSNLDPVYMELTKKYKGEKSKYIPLIFDRLLSVEEAKLVLQLPVSSKEELAEKLVWDIEKTGEKVRELYEKGVLYFTKKGIRPPHHFVEIHDATLQCTKI